MSFAAGWYHAQGDPVGTVRRWNGTEWIGFPVADPNLADDYVEPFAPSAGQVLLKPFAIAAQLALMAVIGVYGMRLYVAMRAHSYQVAVNDNALLDISDTRESIDRLASIQTFVWTSAVFFLLLFGVLWFWRAMRNMRLWHKPIRHKTSIFVRYTPLFMMLELQSHSPRKGHEGEMNPVLAWGWWALFAGAGAVDRALERSSYGSTEAAPSLLVARMGLVVLTMISFCLAIILVEQITKHQDRRMVPTAAQRRKLAEQQALQESLAHDPYRTNADSERVLYGVQRS